MPINKYYKGHGSEVMNNMKKEYGDKKGKEVFYATANKKGLTAEDAAEDIKENHMAAPQKTRIQKLIEAIKSKRWHDANVLTSRILEDKVMVRLDEERKGMFKGGFVKECPIDGDGGSPMSDNPGLKKEDADKKPNEKPFGEIDPNPTIRTKPYDVKEAAFGGKQAPPFGKKAVKENAGAKDAGANDKQQSHKDFLKNLKKKK